MQEVVTQAAVDHVVVADEERLEVRGLQELAARRQQVGERVATDGHRRLRRRGNAVQRLRRAVAARAQLAVVAEGAVLARAVGDPVEAGLAVQVVVLALAEQRVVAGLTVNDVIAGLAVDEVGAADVRVAQRVGRHEHRELR